MHFWFECFITGLEECETPKQQLIGYAIYFYSYSTWEGKSIYLEDLYVTPEYRAKGVGSALFNKVAKVKYFNLNIH